MGKKWKWTSSEDLPASAESGKNSSLKKKSKK